MGDPRRYDLFIRSTVTGLIAVTIVLVAAYEGIHGGKVDEFTQGAALLILGFYYGSHASLNGSGVRAARDQQLTEQLLNASARVEPPPPIEPPDDAVHRTA